MTAPLTEPWATPLTAPLWGSAAPWGSSPGRTVENGAAAATKAAVITFPRSETDARSRLCSASGAGLAAAARSSGAARNASRSTRSASKWLSAVRNTLTKRSSPTRNATVLRVSAPVSSVPVTNVTSWPILSRLRLIRPRAAWIARSASTRSIPCRLRMAIRVSPERTLMTVAEGGRGSGATRFALGSGSTVARSATAALATARGWAGGGSGSFVIRLENRPFSSRSTRMRRPCGNSMSSQAMRGSKPGTGRFVMRTVMPAGRRRGLNTRRRLCTRASASGLRTSASRSTSIRVLPARRVRRSSRSSGSLGCSGPS